MEIKFFVLLLTFSTISDVYVSAGKPGLFTPVYQWSQLEFDYQNEQERQQDIDQNVFIPGIPAPIDVDVQYSSSNNGFNKHRIFVTIPKFQQGIPVTLGTVSSSRNYNGNPIIKPYPSWSWHRNPTNCNAERIISVYRVQIDECGRLWVMDTGHLLDRQVCPPQILAFDLNTDRLIHRYEIPADQIEPRSLFVTPMVEVRDRNLNCKDTFVYMADCQTYSIVVHDVRRSTSWRVSDKSMYPFPTYGTYSILGDSFELMDGVLGMSLSPKMRENDDNRRLFYHAMSSPTENWVYTRDLRNQTRFLTSATSSPEIFHTYVGERKTQTAAEAIDRNGVMFFGLMSDVTIDCWNINSEYGPRYFDVIGNDTQTLQFASGVKVITNAKNVEELWIMTSRFQKVATGTLTTSETNFRIQAAKIDDLVYSTRCRNHNHAGGYGLLKPQSEALTYGHNGYRPPPRHHY